MHSKGVMELLIIANARHPTKIAHPRVHTLLWTCLVIESHYVIRKIFVRRISKHWPITYWNLLIYERKRFCFNLSIFHLILKGKVLSLFKSRLGFKICKTNNFVDFNFFFPKQIFFEITILFGEVSLVSTIVNLFLIVLISTRFVPFGTKLCL